MRAIHRRRLSPVAPWSDQTQARRRGTHLYRQGRQGGFDHLQKALLDRAGQQGLICMRMYMSVCLCVTYRSVSQWFCCLPMHAQMYASVFRHCIITNV